MYSLFPPTLLVCSRGLSSPSDPCARGSILPPAPRHIVLSSSYNIPAYQAISSSHCHQCSTDFSVETLEAEGSWQGLCCDNTISRPIANYRRNRLFWHMAGKAWHASRNRKLPGCISIHTQEAERRSRKQDDPVNP